MAVHAPLGEVEWPNTVEFIRTTLPPGVPLPELTGISPAASGRDDPTVLNRA